MTTLTKPDTIEIAEWLAEILTAPELSADRLAEALMAPILNRGGDPLEIQNGLAKLQETLSAVSERIADERATVILDERQTKESIASLARRIGSIKQDRVADFVKRGERLRKEDSTPWPMSLFT